MTPYLKQVAEHYFPRERKLESLCFIFPNRRALSFFKKYLGETIAASSKVPVTAPSMLTISDFFYRVAGVGKTDKVHLLLELYAQYAELMPKAEDLDEFIFWGDVILADFDDVDKYLVNPSHLFTNVADYKSIQDTYEYLTERQLEAINRFLKHFRNEAELTVDMDRDKDYKARFLRIWDILLPLYENFGATLRRKGISYEGQVYRSVADSLNEKSAVDLLSETFQGITKFVFVGLNAPNECEKKVMGKMRNAGIAEFCWDYSSSWIKNPHNKASLFLDKYVDEFPQAFKPDPEGLPQPVFNVISVPSGVGCAKQLPEILTRIAEAEGKTPDINTAIVLPDEKMLIPVLNSLPEDIKSLNVTMGYPMGGSELWNLMNDIAGLQMHLREKDGAWYFYHRQVWTIFSNSIIRNVLSEDGLALVARIKKAARYYVAESEFAADPVLSLIFRPIVRRADVKDKSQIRAICDYQCEILSGIAPLLQASPEMTIELDFAREYYLAVSRLRTHTDERDECRLEVLPVTYFRLLNQLVGASAVPFQGEPLRGLQIMGPLETRALDFDNLVILNCNEGTFPSRSVSSSFVPPELRKGFGLPTYEFQDAVWAYYFYRMIQRAGSVWMLYDSRTEGTKSGEQSRYIRQLELHFGATVNHYVVKAPISSAEDATAIVKTDEHIAMLHEHELSASALQSYLSCPAKFYYHSVCRLKEQDEISESLDAGMLGDVFHKSMEDLYRPFEQSGELVTAEWLDAKIKDRRSIRALVDRKIKEALHTFEIAGRNIIFEDVVIQYVLKVLQRDRELLDEYHVGGFKVLGLELKKLDRIGDYDFKGFIDRLDSFDPSEVRVVDYKTGKVTDDDFKIDESNAESVVESLFGPDNSKRPKIALQLYLYDRFMQGDEKFRGKSFVNTIYQTARLFVEPVTKVALDEKFCSLMEERVEKLLEEISDTSIPWNRTDQPRTCEYCDFKMICGR